MARRGVLVIDDLRIPPGLGRPGRVQVRDLAPICMLSITPTIRAPPRRYAPLR